MVNQHKIERIKKSPFKIWDIIIFAGALVLVIVLVFSVFKKDGDTVLITNDAVTSRFSLDEDRVIELEGKLKVTILKRTVYVSDATCNNKTCENMGIIKYVNQSITCAQNKVVVKIVGKDGLAGVVGQG